MEHLTNARTDTFLAAVRNGASLITSTTNVIAPNTDPTADVLIEQYITEFKRKLPPF